MNTGDRQETWVAVTFTHDEKVYTIKRTHRYTCTERKKSSDGIEVALQKKPEEQLSFIASLVSMAKDKILDDAEMQLGQEYPIVMDAPFSNVDEIHINNICKILPNTANQVIMAVMKKDWDYAADNLASFVGMSYLISKDTDADGNEIETSTHIVRAEV